MEDYVISINSMPPCGFGNRLLYYYNLRQEAHKRDCGFCCIPWDGYQFFEGDMLGANGVQSSSLDFCLGDRFYAYDGLPTRDVFKLKEIPNISEFTCAVHFRGTVGGTQGFHLWNPEAILDYKYYYDGIQAVINSVQHFILFTDDPQLDSFIRIRQYLLDEGINFSEGTRQNYIDDFAFMSECDYIISSPSTFCISAGCIGKKKKIIHSEKWVKDRANKNDRFWDDLLEGGNEDYSLWRLL